jgi:hypothetical protein
MCEEGARSAMDVFSSTLAFHARLVKRPIARSRFPFLMSGPYHEVRDSANDRSNHDPDDPEHASSRLDARAPEAEETNQIESNDEEPESGHRKVKSAS